MPIFHSHQQLELAVRGLSLRDRVRRVSLFGSRARGAATHDSDLDLLIEFSGPIGFFAMGQVQRELEQSLGQAVDLVTPASLSPYIREEALRDAIPVYEA